MSNLINTRIEEELTEMWEDYWYHEGYRGEILANLVQESVEFEMEQMA